MAVFREELTFSDYWVILKRRRWPFTGTIILFTVATGIFTWRQEPVYEGIARLLIMTEAGTRASATALLGAIGGAPSAGSPADEAVSMMGSRTMMEHTAKRLGLIPEGLNQDDVTQRVLMFRDKFVRVNRVEAGQIIEIVVESTIPREVAEYANGLAGEFVLWSGDRANIAQKNLAIHLQKKLEEQDGKIKISRGKIREFQEHGYTPGLSQGLASQKLNLESELEVLKVKYQPEHQKIVDINRRLDVIDKQLRLATGQALEMGGLELDLALSSQLWRDIKIELEKAEAAASTPIQTAQLTEPAGEPSKPIRPNKKLNLSLGLVLGLVLGSLLAFILENLDTSIGTIEDVESFLKLPVIGVIPYTVAAVDPTAHTWKRFFRRRSSVPSEELSRKLTIYQGARSQSAEAYRALRANISLALAGGKKKAMLFTSAGPGEGKTLTVCNYALAAAEAGLKTLLIDADLRRPTVHKLFGLTADPGVAEISMHQAEWPKVLRGTTDFLLSRMMVERVLAMPGIEHLKIITSGTMVQNPQDIIEGEFWETMINDAKRDFDLILFDCAPLLMFADGMVLSRYVDGLVIVYQIGRTARNAVQRVKTQLDKTHAPILGVVINGLRADESPYYYKTYYYSKYYEDAKKRTPT